MSKTLYLHIGIHKTGTTAIQNFFWNNRQKLQSLGWCYPEIGLSGITHAGFVNSVYFAERRKSLVKLKSDFSIQGSPYVQTKDQNINELIVSLKNRVSNAQEENFLLSSECFFEWTTPQVFADLFFDIFEKVHVIIYLREQIDWIGSVYNQLIKDSYFQYSGSVLELPQLYLTDYFSILQNWESAFGKDSLLVRVYNSKVAENAVEDILQQIGLDYKGEWSWHDNHKHNLSLHPQLANLMHLINKQNIDLSLREEILNVFIKLGDDLGQDSDFSLLSMNEIQEIRKMISKSNQKLYQEYGIRFDNLIGNTQKT